jgi:hypothetical protein
MVSNLDAFSYLVFVITDAIVAYSAFWALNVRKALFVSLYRNQALGIVTVAVSLGVVELAELLALVVTILNGTFYIPISWI